jgi:uncharacterized membrane protein
MLRLCSPAVPLVLLVTAIGLLIYLLFIRLLPKRNKQTINANKERDSSWLLIGMLVVALLSISAFGIYVFLFKGPC